MTTLAFVSAYAPAWEGHQELDTLALAVAAAKITYAAWDAAEELARCEAEDCLWECWAEACVTERHSLSAS